MALVGNPADWREGSKQAVLRDALADLPVTHTAVDCAVCDSVIAAMTPVIGTWPIVFRRKRNGAWFDLPQWQAETRLRHLVYEIHQHVTEYVPSEAPVAPPAPVSEAPKVTVSGRDSESQKAADELIRWIQKDLRPLAHRKGPDGKTLDEVGLRPAENGAKMLTAGIPIDAVKHALTLTYPPEARRVLGVGAYDVTAFEPRTWGAVTVPSDAASHSGVHRAMAYVEALASVRVPIALTGPAGTGKTTIAKQLADRLKWDFGMVSMTNGTSPSAFNGRPKIGGDGGVVDSQFEKIYRNGGVFLFDEMDASEPGLLLLVNAALANGTFANSAKGEKVPRSPNFVPIAGMNTLGLGADGRFVAREKLDAATLDRWNAGRVEVKLDETLERHLFWETVA